MIGRAWDVNIKPLLMVLKEKLQKASSCVITFKTAARRNLSKGGPQAGLAARARREVGR